MYVTRSDGQRLMELGTPIKIQCDEPVMLVFDQSSSSTGMVVGTLKNRVVEIFCFERDRGETVQAYLSKLKQWLLFMVSELEVKVFAIEHVPSTNRYRSDLVTKQVRGQMIDIHYEAKSKMNGQTVQMRTVSEFVEQNNQEWFSNVIPKDYITSRSSKDRKKAAHRYMTKFFPAIWRMREDVADALGIYFHLIQTRYASTGLRPARSNIKRDHDIIVNAIPYIPPTVFDMPNYEKQQKQGYFDDEALEFLKTYKLEYFKTFASTLTNQYYEISEILKHKSTRINALTERFMKYQENKEQLLESLTTLLRETTSRKVYEFEFNDKMYFEDNFRAFTSQSREVYLTEVKKSLHWNYLIPLYSVFLTDEESLLLVGTRI